MVEIDSSSEWFLNHNNNNHHNTHNTNNNNNNNNSHTNNSNGGTFLAPLPVLANSGANVLNKSIEWLYSGNGNENSHNHHSINTSSNKVTKLSNGFSLLINQDGTQSPSCFLNLSSTSGNHDEPVQVPMMVPHNNGTESPLYQFNISPQLQSQHHHHQHQQQQPQQQQQPISPVPQSYQTTSSAGSSPIQEYPYFSPSSSPHTVEQHSPILLNLKQQIGNNTSAFQFSSLKQTTGIPATISSNTSSSDFNMVYNYVHQTNSFATTPSATVVKLEDSLLSQIQTSVQQQQLQNPYIPFNTSTPVSVPTTTTILSSANSSTNSSPNNSHFVSSHNNQLNNNSNNNNNIQQQNNNNNMDIEEPFSQEKFLSHLKSIVPSFNENYDGSSESSAQSEESQESDYDNHGERNNNGKKRSREEDEIDTSGQTILSREKVLKLTSKEIEEYVSRLKMNHVLTQAEEKELKKQRRLVKNREYASQSRSRRKIYVENIESKLQKTNQDCASIKSQLNSVKEENKALKKQLYSLTSTLKSNPSLAEAFGKIFSPIGNNKTSSATLFVFFFLFTFTFLFNSPISFSQSSLTFNSDSVSSIQRNLLGLEDSKSHSEWTIKKAILEETKQYVDSLLASLYTSKLSDIPLDTSSYIVSTKNNSTTTAESTSTTTTESAKVISVPSEDISNVLSGLTVSDVEQQSKESLISNSPPLSPLTTQ